MSKKLMIAGCCSMLMLSACGSVNSSMSANHKTVEFYRIFDVHTNANRQDVADLAAKGLSRWVSNVNERRPIPSSAELPEKPGRFKVKQVQMSGNMAALMAMSGQGLPSSVTCDGATWIGTAVKTVAGTDGINLTACLFQYKGGYHLDVYGTYSEQSSGFTLNPYELGAKMAKAVTGTPGEWMDKMIADTTQEIKTGAHAQVAFLEGYPKSTGQPWWATKETAAK